VTVPPECPSEAPPERPALATIAQELLVYLLLALCLASRGALPDLAYLPLALTVALVALIPAWLLPTRRDAGTLARLACAMGLGLLLQLRAPILIPGISIATAREDTLEVSVEAAVALLLAVALVLGPRRKLEPHSGARSSLTRLVPPVAGGLILLFVLLWPLCDSALRAGGASGLRYAGTLRSLSIVAEYGVLLMACLTVERPWHLRRLATVVAAALLARGFLPPTGGA
jgi:hypothetical protein